MTKTNSNSWMQPMMVASISSVMWLTATNLPAETFKIENAGIQRVISTDQQKLSTKSVTNPIIKATEANEQALEFSIALQTPQGKSTWSAKDFTVKSAKKLDAAEGNGVAVVLESEQAPVSVTVRYWADAKLPVLRKSLKVTAKQDVTIDRVEVESLKMAGAYAPYKPKTIIATGSSQWRPPLGQPIYTRDTGLWCGLEFPASRNSVTDGNLSCAYLTKVELKKDQSFDSYAAAMGSADDKNFVKEAFFDYIDQTRARPLRLQTQYNSWFDFGNKVTAEDFNKTAKKVNEELCVKRGVPPLKAYVVDDGWQDAKADWSKTGVWPINEKFDANFASTRATVAEAKSKLGLWVSPGCVFGGQPAVPAMKAAGWKSLDAWMSMTDPSYMDGLEKRLVELAASPVVYFKLDGIFGHLNKRVFDVEGFQGGEPALNDAKHDEAKERYLSLGSARLMKIFKEMGKVNPDVYVTISNGAYLSPWWLQTVDAVWMINAGDAAGGADRTAELVYRDNAYYRLASDEVDATQFPLHSIFNHEPKKTSTGEDADTFRRYLYMNLSRGTGFVELYLKTPKLADGDWDVLAEGMKWVHHVFPNFKTSKMIGGNPQKGDVYGYTGWTDSTGYVSLHNPSNEAKTYTITLGRAFGQTRQAAQKAFVISSPFAGDMTGLETLIRPNDSITIQLPAKAIRVFEFNAVESKAKPKK